MNVKIIRVLNTNAVVSVDSQGMELIMTGPGIGLKKRKGENIDQSLVDKTYHLENKEESKRLQEVVKEISEEYLGIVDRVVKEAKKEKLEIRDSLYVTLTDHINFAIERVSQGIEPQNALLYGIFTVVTVLLGFRAGFSFSAGATDLLFSASLPAAQKTWLIIPLGIAAFIVFYVVFRFAILKFDLKTPGREDDDMDETTVKLANDNFTEVAKIILEGVGGKGNVASIDNCITRLRLEIKDYTAVDEKKIKSAGVAGVIRPGKNSVQVVIGTKVQFVADEFKKLCK